MSTVKEEILAAIATTLNNATAARALAEQLPDDGAPLPPPEPTPTETVIRVKAGEDLNKALIAASVDTSGKDVRVRVQPATQYSSANNFRMPVKAHKRNIFVEPDWDNDANLGARLIDQSRTDLPFLLGSNINQATLIATGAVNGWYWRGFGVSKTGSSRAQIELGDTVSTSVATVPQNIAFLQCIIHGDPVGFQRRGIMSNCGNLLVDRCDMRHHGAVGADGQNICGWNGPGPFTIVGSFLEGAGENVMFGGGTVMSGLMVPSNVTIRGCHFSKNLAWLTAAIKPSVKNLLEFKNVQDAIVEGCLFENNWTQGQAGGAILFKAAANNEPQPWTRCHRVAFRHNVVRRAGGFLSINNSEGIGPTLGCRDISVENCIAYELGTGQFTGNAHGFRFGGGPDNIRLAHNTLLNGHSLLYLWNDPAIDNIAGLQIIGNLAREADYGVFGTLTSGQGTPTLAAYAPGYQWAANVLEEGSSVANYPTSTTKVPAGTLAVGKGLDAQFRPTNPAILAVKDSAGVVAGADVGAILALFSQYGVDWK